MLIRSPLAVNPGQKESKQKVDGELTYEPQLQ